ncbi:MAG TPA: hypothetical protein VIJ25_06885 [Methylococcales bacterium]
MNPLDLVKLMPLMQLTHGRPEIVVGLIDGAVAMKHPELVGANIREFAGKLRGYGVGGGPRRQALGPSNNFKRSRLRKECQYVWF